MFLANGVFYQFSRYRAFKRLRDELHSGLVIIPFGLPHARSGDKAVSLSPQSYRSSRSSNGNQLVLKRQL